MKLEKAEIWKAADDLVREGLKPTVQAVRDRVGYGSFEKIAPAMAEWRARQDVDRSVVTPMPADLRERGEAHVRQLWSAAMAAADASMHAEREGLKAAQAELAQQQVELGRVADDLASQLSEAQKTAEALRGKNEAMAGEVTALRSQAAALQARYEDAERFRAEERAERQGLQRELERLRSMPAGSEQQPVPESS